ncbi:MAG: DNA-directed RNA polymerase subunit beta [Candidatus Bipolaricaulota bacterium]|nr:DNA-directed RNA polymerase subunit beta [Candidatus Bipolaricaulota bacterium]MCS7274948.1 DNA-directed RNA polymerase subunit beta [Candidatus Bipolaricaulota bacterium]MDW8110192.1 DNA-directed RNA polymerase subunit beta [Candidatus Bipolaricaulota bacterium]MDW8329706.1 DNA-directed RNA polymerase subunit beta [Candidatus Bipolaricaulota bacterium]
MRTRRSWGRVSHGVELPYLLHDQKRSYERFLTEGIREAFQEIGTIKGEGRENIELEMTNPRLGPPPYSEQECKDKNRTYAAPLRVYAVLRQDGKKVREDDLYIADVPLMTARGTFIINGSENVIVNHLTRSPGVYFTKESPTEYLAQILPDYGAWLEFVLDVKKERIQAQLDRKGNLPPTTLLRALGYTTSDIYKLYSVTVNPISREKLARYRDCVLTEPVSVKNKLIAREGQRLTDDIIEQILELGVPSVQCLDIYIQRSLDEDKTSSAEEALDLIYRKLRGAERPTQKIKQDFFINLFFNPETFSLSRVGRFMVNKKLGLKRDLNDVVLHKEEIALTLKRLLEVPTHPELIEDKDHLANKRVKPPGETALDALRAGLKRMVRLTQDRLGKLSLEEEEPLRNLISGRTVQAALNKLFYTGRLSQFLEQTNPLTELTHKRRLSAMAGSSNKKRAKIEVRDVHYSHYDRICPIETPEGQNIGLITSMATYARINDFGFLEAPYRVVKNGRLTKEIIYLMADEEEKYRIAPATTPVDKEGRIIPEVVEIRTGKENIRTVPREQVDLIEVSPAALVSVSASLIPFLEHDDANRALMGANMQRQAVPLLKPQAPYVGTGMEAVVARDSGLVVLAEEDGQVIYVDAQKIVVRSAAKPDKKSKPKDRVYSLITFDRSNQDTLVHQRPVVEVGQKVKKGDLLADGPSTDHGELALGANVLVAFLPFEGYNYEDAIVISERLVREDILDSIHIQEYEVRAEETKLGPEEITDDIPDLSKEDLRNLDEDGVVRVGTEVKTGDILVGKITPKGESEPTPEERIFKSIFGERSRNVRNTSLRLPPTTEGGKVIRVKKFSAKKGDDLGPGVNQLVKVYIAQRKKISIADKLAGRHGNKGVIAKILPVEDMPFLPDGTPVDMVLNPLGVPSRMNLGQVFETHLGWLAHLRGEYMASPVFDGAKEEQILNELYQERVKHGLAEGDDPRYPVGKVWLRDGRTGEPFEHPVTVGYMYMLKLEHIANEKIHARSVGPYSLITQQPLGGKAQMGGQRLGEMEVWALEAYGAAHTLQEMLTLKSDDTRGRVQLYKAIFKGEEFPKPGLPESFKVLVKELRSLGLSVRAYDQQDREINIS